MHLLGGSPGAVFLGTITRGLAHGDTVFDIIPAFSKISISSCTHCTCLRAKVYGLCVTGGLFSVGISILREVSSPNLLSPWKRYLEIQRIGSQMLLYAGVLLQHLSI